MAIRLENLTYTPGARTKKHRKGRGHAAGKGKQAGRGQSGQKNVQLFVLALKVVKTLDFVVCQKLVSAILTQKNMKSLI